MLTLRELLHSIVPLGLGGLACILRFVVPLLGGEQLLLGCIQRGACGGLRRPRLFRSCSSSRHGKAGD